MGGPVLAATFHGDLECLKKFFTAFAVLKVPLQFPAAGHSQFAIEKFGNRREEPLTLLIWSSSLLPMDH